MNGVVLAIGLVPDGHDLNALRRCLLKRLQLRLRLVGEAITDAERVLAEA
jgi:hypothetical protein